MNINPKHKKSQKGFTLVELAIVMIIIGLLIVGILKGQEMIANAQVTATISQIKGLDAAMSTFRDMYDVLPGDIRDPGTRLASCTGTCNQAGNGDGRIGANSVGAAFAINTEERAAFTHLAAANLVTGVSINPTGPTIEGGDEVPLTEIGASSYTVAHTGTGNATGLIGPLLRGGHYLAISPVPGAALPTATGTAALSATQTARIDRKIDDGTPNTGTVRVSGFAAGCVTGTTVTDNYNESNDTLSCNPLIRIQN